MDKKNRKGKSLVIIIILLSIITVISLCTALWAVKEKGGSDNFADTKQDVTTQQSTLKNPDSIAIPGYEIIDLKADRKKQSIALNNPAQNMCYFKITLTLSDGSELWKSELIKPGENSKPIVLNKSLKEGIYRNAVLKYECFSADKELKALNNAQTKLTLRVTK